VRVNFGLATATARVGAALCGAILGGCLAMFELRRLVSDDPEPRRMGAAAITVCLLGAAVASWIALDALRGRKARADEGTRKASTHGTVGDYFARRMRETDNPAGETGP
jgi:hypothetical protein